jgi:hypothetical protein
MFGNWPPLKLANLRRHRVESIGTNAVDIVNDLNNASSVP